MLAAPTAIDEAFDEIVRHRIHTGPNGSVALTDLCSAFDGTLFDAEDVKASVNRLAASNHILVEAHPLAGEGSDLAVFVRSVR